MTKEQIREFTLRTCQSNHSGLILVLFDVEKIYLHDAVAAYNAGDVDGYTKNIDMVRRTHNELMSAVNPSDLQGRRILSILRFIYDKLVLSSIRKQPQQLDRCQKMMDNLRKCFVQLHELDEEGPVMQNTHQVYAGLTYGRGVLNESVEGMNYGSRGFKA